MATVRLLPIASSFTGAIRRCHYSRYITTSEAGQSPDRPHISAAAFEKGCTAYYCNRNPRNLELLGIADKPKGFETKNQRVDYYHRYKQRKRKSVINPSLQTDAGRELTSRVCLRKP